MDDARRMYREGERTVRKAAREVDGHNVGDDIGNAGDEIRKNLGNAGDEIRRAADRVADKVRTETERRTG